MPPSDTDRASDDEQPADAPARTPEEDVRLLLESARDPDSSFDLRRILKASWEADPARCLGVLDAAAAAPDLPETFLDALCDLIQRHPLPDLLDVVYRCVSAQRLDEWSRLGFLGELVKAGHAGAESSYIALVRKSIEHFAGGGEWRYGMFHVVARDVNMSSLRVLLPDLKELGMGMKRRLPQRGTEDAQVAALDAAMIEATIVRFEHGRQGLRDRLRADRAPFYLRTSYIYSLACEGDPADASLFAELYRQRGKKKVEERWEALGAYIAVAPAHEIDGLLAAELTARAPVDPARLANPGCLFLWVFPGRCAEVAQLLDAARYGPPPSARILALVRPLLRARAEWVAARAWLVLKRSTPDIAMVESLDPWVYAAEESTRPAEFDLAARRWGRDSSLQ